MNIIDIITKKRNGGMLNSDEIEFIVQSDIPDYQLSALLMAIYIKGLNELETIGLTYQLAKSGKQFDFTDDNAYVDLHSTGGVGDKCSLIVLPIVAACGVKVAKLAGRGLGHTGGTVDKLESFTGLSCDLSPEQFEKQVGEIGIAIAAQTAEITPKDGEFYRLRDVTGTIESIPLIASSIMSKKLATGCPNIVLDVTYGSGAFMKTKKDAKRLANLMVKIGQMSGRNTLAVLTPMNEPLGNTIGNTLEVEEAIAYLKGEGIVGAAALGRLPSKANIQTESRILNPESSLHQTCTLLAVNMLKLGLNLSITEAYR
ncbi:MAG: thymidine phosphorylase, partial [Oscillospiraceae bacterium]|nr:thymidine phosphorylase [Oscillospiraceae bacterium]